MYEIHVVNSQSLMTIQEDWVRKVVQEALTREDVADAELTVALVSDDEIHVLNRKHLGHDYATDVISFAYHPSREGRTPRPVPRGAGLTIDGELVISTETACRSAEEYGWNPHDELTLYLVHGLLHLCGYDDQTDDERALMRRREQEILQTWQVTPQDSF